MDFKKLFRKDDKAVSPVIGVILMVAITVILAAAIGSSVFSHGTAQSAPQANINVKQGTVDTITLEHLGGDSFRYDGADFKVYENGTISSTSKVDNSTTATTFSAGDIVTITDTGKFKPNTNVNVKVVDKATNQLICDKSLKIY